MDTPTTFDELVELAARGPHSEEEWAKFGPLYKELRRGHVRDGFLAAIEAGLLVVPAEATEEMEVAAAVAWQKIWTGWAHVLNAANAAGALRPEEEVDDRQQG